MSHLGEQLRAVQSPAWPPLSLPADIQAMWGADLPGSNPQPAPWDLMVCWAHTFWGPGQDSEKVQLCPWVYPCVHPCPCP